MGDLISRSELVKLLEDRKREHYENYESFINYMCNRRLEHETEYEECKRILTIVANQPTIEAVPVVYGKWIKVDGDWRNSRTDEPLTVLRCSECGNCFIHAPYNFCPECGADMRGNK